MLDEILPVRHHRLHQVGAVEVAMHHITAHLPFDVLVRMDCLLHFWQVQVVVGQIFRTRPEERANRLTQSLLEGLLASN